MSASTDGIWVRPSQEPELSYPEYVAANVRALMGRHRVSGVQLAAWIGVSPSQVSKRLNGRIPFDTEEIGRMATAFRVDTTAITGGWIGPSGPTSGSPGSQPTMAYADALSPLRLLITRSLSPERVAA